MHVDLDQSEATPLPETRFCIIGGGIAGLFLAHRLASRGFSVTLLEAGGLELEDRSQALYAAEMAATPHTGSQYGRFRTFGGSSTRWGGQLLPYTEDVFHPLPGSPSASWPIGEEEIQGYYGEIQRMLGVGVSPFMEQLPAELGLPMVPLGPELRLRYSKWMPFRQRNLAHTLGRQCLAHPLVQVVTHANVATLEGHCGRIASATALDYRGRRFEFRAGQFVVCCGTVESSRLLLSSPAVPNRHDQLGRYFHDHVSLHAAIVPASAHKAVFTRLGPFLVDGILHTCKLEATAELRRDRKLLATMAHIVIEEPEDSGIAAVRSMLVSLQHGRFKQAAMRDLLPMLRGIGDVMRLAWSLKVRRRRAAGKRANVWLNIDLEQAPAPENRVRLSESRDALGLAKAIVDWRVGHAERETARGFASLLKPRLEAAGFPAFDWMPGLLDGGNLQLADTYHAMGGLRMGTDPSGSVVDPNLRVHGLENLYVASCAVFPSGGSSNPTFTMIALTLRLADRLSGR